MPIIPIPPDQLAAHSTLADLAEWLGTEAPAGAERLLRRASELVDAHTTTCYATDEETGLATDEEECGYLAALRDATCAQVEQWILAGEHNDIDGMAGQDVSTMGLSVTRPRRLAPRAATILRSVDLL